MHTALEAKPDGKVVADHHEEGGQDAGGGHLVGSIAIRQKIGQRDAKPTFEDIRGEDQVAPFLAKHAQGVRCADIAATLLAKIDPFGSPGQVAARNGTNKVGSEGDQGG